MGQPLPLIVVERPPENGAAYAVERMFDNAQGSCWCTPIGAVLPVAMTFQVTSGPAFVDAVFVDGRVPGFETCSPAQVSVEVASPQHPGRFTQVASGFVPLGAVGQIALPQPVAAQQVRLVIHSNHGGQHAAIAELRVMGTPAGAAGGYGMPQPYGGGAMPQKGAMGSPAHGGMGPGIPVGARVQAQWNGGGWYDATVTNTDGAMYEVAWDDGSEPSWLGPHEIRYEGAHGVAPGVGYAKQQQYGKVDPYAQKQQQQYGKVDPYAQQQQAGYGKVDPYAQQAGYGKVDPYAQKQQQQGYGKVDPYAQKQQAGYGKVDPYAQKQQGYGHGGAGGVFPIGARVQAEWEDGQWFPATIRQFDGAMYEVAWDDGSAPTWLEPGMIRGGY